MSTTMTAAYTIASEDILVYEAQVTRALSVIIPVGDHILLAVNGPARAPSPHGDAQSAVEAVNGEQEHADPEEDGHSMKAQLGAEESSEQDQFRQELQEVAEALAAILREELAGLKWPGDI